MLSTFEQLQIELNFYYFFFNVPTTTEIYTLSLHDALPISRQHRNVARRSRRFCRTADAMVKRPRAVRYIREGRHSAGNVGMPDARGRHRPEADANARSGAATASRRTSRLSAVEA